MSRTESPGTGSQTALAQIGQVVEGYHAARAVHEVALRAGVEMPLCDATYRVLYEGLEVREALRELMARAIRPETDPARVP